MLRSYLFEAAGAQNSRDTAGKDVPAGTVAVVRSPDFLRAFNQRDRACNIDPPASFLRHHAEAREQSGSARMIAGELDTQTRN